MSLSAQDIAVLAAALGSVVLAGLAMIQRPATGLRWSFALGMVGLAAEALAVFALLVVAESPDTRLFWLRLVLIAGCLLLLPWGGFVAALTTDAMTRRPSRWPVAAAVGAALLVLSSVTLALVPPVEVAGVDGPFYAAPLAWPGLYSVIVQLLMTAVVLGGLEAALRFSTGITRWRIKYLVLGLGGVFLVRFYLLSQVLLFQVVMAVYLTTAAAALVIGHLVIGAALIRNGLVASTLTVSRQVLYRSVVILVLGLYLSVIGGLGWLLNRLGIAEELFWGSFIVFTSAVTLAAVLLSEDIRWRIKRFIALHFYKSKYDYRAHWAAFTRRLGSLLTLPELAPELLRATIEAVGATRGALYLRDERNGGPYHLAAATGTTAPLPALPAQDPVVVSAERDSAPLALTAAADAALGPGPGSDVGDHGTEFTIAVPLRWQGTTVGLMMIGPERTGIAYSGEDVEFLATIGQQAAGAIVTTRLSETVARSREFEAFHRLTSFVVHDLKNAVATLALLTRNALDHFDDAEFQRDAIKTLSATVEKMRLLLRRLGSARDLSGFDFVEVDLRALVAEATVALSPREQLRLVTDLRPVPPIAADAAALTSVVQNLLANAVEAMDGHGDLTVRVGARDRFAFCAVGDTGCGMTPEFIRSSLFLPFRSTKKGGWGIGLYQVQQIVAAHQGKIEVESAEGRGTTFTVLFPAAPAATVDGFAGERGTE